MSLAVPILIKSETICRLRPHFLSFMNDMNLQLLLNFDNSQIKFLFNPFSEPEPMTEVDLRQASTAIGVFGYPLVSKAYSKTWSYREDALLEVQNKMQAHEGSKEEAKSMIRAAIFLVKKGIDDKVNAVRIFCTSSLFYWFWNYFSLSL